MNEIGNRYGRVTLKEKLTYRKYVGVCDCGTVKRFDIYHLRNGSTTSCGCLHKQQLSERNTKHGMSKTPEYTAWCKIKRKTTNPKDGDWYLYGARGIKMSEEFFNSFDAFYEYLGPRPNDGSRYSVGRIDNNKGYERGNIRWEDDHTQAQNRRMVPQNTSGVTGVCLSTKVIAGRTYTAWVAYWIPLNSSEKRTKNFSTNKYGYDRAFELAVQYREQKIKELNENGAAYTASHGK